MFSIDECRVAVEKRGDLVLGVADTGQVGDRGQPGFMLNAHDQVVSPLARRAARAVGHRNKRGLQRLQLGDRVEELFRGLVGLGWEELETERGWTSLEIYLECA